MEIFHGLSLMKWKKYMVSQLRTVLFSFETQWNVKDPFGIDLALRKAGERNEN